MPYLQAMESVTPRADLYQPEGFGSGKRGQLLFRYFERTLRNGTHFGCSLNSIPIQTPRQTRVNHKGVRLAILIAGDGLGPR